MENDFFTFSLTKKFIHLSSYINADKVVIKLKIYIYSAFFNYCTADKHNTELTYRQWKLSCFFYLSVRLILNLLSLN